MSASVRQKKPKKQRLKQELSSKNTREKSKQAAQLVQLTTAEQQFSSLKENEAEKSLLGYLHQSQEDTQLGWHVTTAAEEI